jgi:hypothetical protein
MYLKIENIKLPNGTADYKGLNIDLFIPGSQVYSNDFNTCLVETSEVISNLINFNVDVIQLPSEARYMEEKEKIEKERPEDPIIALQKENEQLKSLMADLASLVLEG